MSRALPDCSIEKFVPLIPPTYANLTRSHGVFAAAGKGVAAAN